MLGDPIADLRTTVAQAVGHLVDALIELDRDIEAFVGQHALMLRDPDRQVEIVARDRGEDQLPHWSTLRFHAAARGARWYQLWCFGHVELAGDVDETLQ